MPTGGSKTASAPASRGSRGRGFSYPNHPFWARLVMSERNHSIAAWWWGRLVPSTISPAAGRY
ncbi:hypothetical protein [Haloarcula regularis]|uniref:hypothetical protein n=1 Tax=Haloarcula regularis TaxID=3033392 RepID=UPI0023E8FA48|nr:hypothetical protein [Halomicroarcula sp. SYNS111]